MLACWFVDEARIHQAAGGAAASAAAAAAEGGADGAALPAEEIGFQQVIARLQASGKPVVTHNGIMDLMFTVDKYVQPLPGWSGRRRPWLHTHA